MQKIDNGWYDTLGDGWWDRSGPVRALHEVNPVRLAYFRRALEGLAPGPNAGRREPLRLLDLGCGGGLMTQPYASLRISRHPILALGVDPSRTSLAAGRRHAAAQAVAETEVPSWRPPHYLMGVGERLPVADGSLDAVCSADALEHVADLPSVLDEVARVLRPGGRFVFDTINRTWMSRLVMIWAAQNVLRFAPRRTHDFDAFIRPDDLRAALEARGFRWGELRGLSLRRHPLDAAWRYARTGELGGFVVSDDTRVSYLGFADRL